MMMKLTKVLKHRTTILPTLCGLLCDEIILLAFELLLTIVTEITPEVPKNGSSYSYFAVTLPISFPLTSNENFMMADARVITRLHFTST